MAASSDMALAPCDCESRDAVCEFSDEDAQPVSVNIKKVAAIVAIVIARARSWRVADMESIQV